MSPKNPKSESRGFEAFPVAVRFVVLPEDFPDFMTPNFRRCVTCRQLAPKETFWRLVRVHPSHQVQLDIGMGRSAYVCQTDECLKGAEKKNRLGRALKAHVPEELFQILRRRLAERSGQDG
jgi:predicted RNA-binding protein YlxR (DUF448 family)